MTFTLCFSVPVRVLKRSEGRSSMGMTMSLRLGGSENFFVYLWRDPGMF